MKKKDLRVGVTYADQNIKPVTLISPLVWSHERYGGVWRLKSGHHRPKRGTIYETGQGVLVLRDGSPAEQFTWVKDNQDLIDQLPDQPAAHPRSDSSYDDLVQTLADRARQAQLRLSVESYMSWPGAYHAAKREHDKLQEAREDERAKLNHRAQDIEHRTQLIRDELAERYGVETVTAQHRWIKGEYDTEQMVVSGYTLSLAQLETILNIENIKESE